MDDRIPELRRQESLYFRAASEGQLLIQRCNNCNRAWTAFHVHCAGCDRPELTAEVAIGRGSVYSFTVVNRKVLASLEPPYAVALIDLVDGVRVVGNIVDSPLDQVHVGMDVEVDFLTIDSETAIPMFRPASDEKDARK